MKMPILGNFDDTVRKNKSLFLKELSHMFKEDCDSAAGKSDFTDNIYNIVNLLNPIPRLLGFHNLPNISIFLSPFLALQNL